MVKTFSLPSAWRGRVNDVVVVDRVAVVSAVLIFVLGGAVADVMVDDNVVEEVTTDAAVDDVVFVDFVVDEMVLVDIVEVVGWNFLTLVDSSSLSSSPNLFTSFSCVFGCGNIS